MTAREVHVCDVCGDSAGLGLGPPLRPFQVWFCGYHWGRLRETQALIADRILAAGETDPKEP